MTRPSKPVPPALLDGSLPLGFRFDFRDPLVIEAGELLAANLVTSISEEVRLGLRTLVVRGLRDGIPPAKLARLIRTVVGLGPRQVQALLNFRRMLFEPYPDPSASLTAKLERKVETFLQKALRSTYSRITC